MSNETEYSELMNALLDNAENAPVTLSAMCVKYLNERNYATALKLAEIVRELEAEDYMFVRLKFVVLHRMRKYADAKLYLESCAEQFGDNGVYVEDRALLGLEFGEYDSVEKLLDENADKLDLMSYNLLKIKRRLYSQTQNEEKLVQTLGLLIALYKDYESILTMGVLYMMHGELERAVRCFEKLKTTGPEKLEATVYYPAVYMLAACRKTMGHEHWREEMTEAADILNIAAYDTEKGLFWLKTLEAEARRQLEEYDEAARCTKEASRLEREYRTKK